MKFSRTLSYAVAALVQLSESTAGQPVSCRQMAEGGDMPKRFLLQILRSLVTHGILRSTRGVEGGYLFARPADQVTLLDVIEAIDGPIRLELPGLDGLSTGSRQTLAKVSEGVRQELARVSLAQLARASSRGQMPEPGNRSHQPNHGFQVAHACGPGAGG